MESENNNGKVELDAVSVNELFQLLPHRYPFLLIDRVEQMEANARAVGQTA